MDLNCRKDYVRLGMERLDRITTGDRLNGSEEPSMSEYAKRDARKASGVEKIQQALFADDADIHESLVSEIGSDHRSVFKDEPWIFG